jgi:hypothetical protein
MTLLMAAAQAPDAGALQFRPRGHAQRSLVERLSQEVWITDYAGADKSGATSSDAALAAAVADLPSGGVVRIPPGRFALANTVISTASLRLKCEPGATLVQTATGGDFLTLSAPFAGVEDCRFQPARVVASGFQLALVNCPFCVVTRPVVQFAYSAYKIMSSTEAVIDKPVCAQLYGSYGLWYGGAASARSFGATIDRLNCSNAPYVAVGGTGAYRSWAPSTAYAVGDVIYQGGYVWQAATAGASAASGSGPSGPPSADPAQAFVVTVADGATSWRMLGGPTMMAYNDSYGDTLRLRTPVLLWGLYGFVSADNAAQSGSAPQFAAIDGIEADHNIVEGAALFAGSGMKMTGGDIISTLAGHGMQVYAGWGGGLLSSGLKLTANALDGARIAGGGVTLVNFEAQSNGISFSGKACGVRLMPGAKKVTIDAGQAGKSSAIGANWQRHGICVEASPTIDYYSIRNIKCGGENSGACVYDAGGGTNKTVSDNF